jgi:hypothetical protein
VTLLAVLGAELVGDAAKKRAALVAPECGGPDEFE